MHKISISLLVIMSLLSSSCSSTRKSLALGLASGAATGAVLGSVMSDNHSRGAMAGGAIGALIGGIASYFIDNGLQERDQETRKETLFNLEKHGVFGFPSSNDHDEMKSNEARSPWSIRETSPWREPREPFGGSR